MRFLIMPHRPTIPDLAKAAGVSISTVNRVINQPESVRLSTRELVLATARRIGFYGLGSIEHSVHEGREKHRLGVLLQQGSRQFYRGLGEALLSEAAKVQGYEIDLQINYLEDLTPDNVAKELVEMGKNCEAVAIVAAQHPMISDAIDQVLQMDVPVASLIAPLTAQGNVSFVGLDNWKVGRTAAWAFDKMVKEPGKIGVLVGNHRYRNQELNESGFRSYFREHNSGFTLLEPLSTYESSAVAREMTEQLLHENPDLCGLFISGGGITGAVAALRDIPHRQDFVAVGYELFETTRAALIDGTLSMVISHPLELFARESIATLIKAKKAGANAGAQNVALGFDIYTSENI